MSTAELDPFTIQRILGTQPFVKPKSTLSERSQKGGIAAKKTGRCFPLAAPGSLLAMCAGNRKMKKRYNEWRESCLEDLRVRAKSCR